MVGLRACDPGYTPVRERDHTNRWQQQYDAMDRSLVTTVTGILLVFERPSVRGGYSKELLRLLPAWYTVLVFKLLSNPRFVLFWGYE